jgi:CubicO group peptidase (beta-lactamase class C family)
VKKFIVTIVGILAVGSFGHKTADAQGLTTSLFERYLESLREQAGIPGMSAVLVQNGVEVWSQGFGRADIDTSEKPTRDTPYLIGDLSQIMGSTLFLKECVEERSISLNDRVVRWASNFPEQQTTLAQVLAHVQPNGTFKYDTARFGALTPGIEQCSNSRYQQLVADEVFARLGLIDSAPGTALMSPTSEDVRLFGASSVARYSSVLRRVAKSYRLDRGRAVRTDLPSVRVDAATGVVTSAGDLARFDASLRYDIYLTRPTLLRAWTPAGPSLPMGLGWFVQTYNNEQVVWQFGQVKDGHSALLVKVPNRGLTFILLANSDALGAPFARDTFDITTSVFASLFLRVYVP